MSTFHTIIQKLSLAVFAICFAFVTVYVPQTWNKVTDVHAGGALGGGATEWTQIANNIELLGVNISSTASAASDAITSFATHSTWIKDLSLDSIGWALAKNILSQMTSSIVNWINTGFKGSPAFVQDLEGFLTNVADKTIGNYISELGGPLSFICSPFQLDVRIALSATYARTRDGLPMAESCTLSGALANIENFMDGDFTQGGWEAWFKVTTAPEIYTPYGNLLAAQSEGSARLINAKGEEMKFLDYGGGFLSTKVCETVHGPGVTKDNCFVSTPGKVIQEALTFQLSTGPQSLIAADEINEIVMALFSQISEKVVTGAAGLLGLSAGTGHTYTGYSGGSYTSQSGTSLITPEQLKTLIDQGLTEENRYLSAALYYQGRLNAHASDLSVNSQERTLASQARDKIPALVTKINGNITKLNSLQTAYTSFGTKPTPAQIQPLIQDYTAIRLHNAEEIDGAIAGWKSIVD